MASVEFSNIIEDRANNNNVDNNIVSANIKQENDCDLRTGETYANNNKSTTNESDDNEKTNLIVNYLPQQMTDDEFEELFNRFGEMKSCKIVRNRTSGYSYGFGFVDFQTHGQALKAIEELNGHELENKKIKVAFARPAGQDIKQANLYIKNVPNDWTQDDVKKIFEPYGNIIQVRVLGSNRGVAFVLYDLRRQAEDALEALNGKAIDGCDAPLEIKFAADKKTDKGGNKNSSPNNSSSNNSNSGNRPKERGQRGGRNHGINRNNRDQQRQGRQSNQRNFYERKNNYDDRQQAGGMRGGQSQYNAIPYGGGSQYSGGNFNNNNNNMNGVGPVRQTPTNRMNRYAPFVPVQQTMVSNPIAPVAAAPMAPQMTSNPAFGFPQQQQMIPFTMAPTQMAPMQAVNPAGQTTQNPMSMYGAAQMPISYVPVTPNAMGSMSTMSNMNTLSTMNAMNNMYSVASNNMNNAANMQPQIGQPMTMRNNNPGSSGAHDDGVTLFVYNIGPDADENELRSMFGPYGQVVKCNVVRKQPGGETKGFGFVTLKDREQANSAISGLNGSMRNGRALQVSLKK